MRTILGDEQQGGEGEGGGKEQIFEDQEFERKGLTWILLLYVGTSNSKKNFGIVSKVPRLVKAGHKFMRVNKNRLFQGKQRGKRGNKINPVDGG